MQQIELRSLGLILSEKQVENLVRNARNLRTENIILKEEIASVKEVST